MKKKLSLKERRQRRRVFLISSLATLGLVLVVGALFGIQHPSVRIAEVAVVGVERAPSDLIQKSVSDALVGSYFFIIPKNSIFFFPKNSIEKTLRDLFHTIKEVSIVRSSFHTITVKVEERAPVALWCGSESADAENCFLMDSSGYVFMKDQNPPTDLIRFVGGGVSKPLGDVFLEGEFESLRTYVDDVTVATDRTPYAVSVDTYGDVRVIFTEGGELRFTSRNASSALLDNIASVFASRRFETDEVLEYADFRFGNKIYVKFVGE